MLSATHVLAVVVALALAATAAVPGVRASSLEIMVERNSADDVELGDDYCTYEFDDVQEAGLPSFEALAAAGLVALLFLGRPAGCVCCDCLNACAPINIATKGLYAVALGVAAVRAGGQYTAVGDGGQFVVQFAAETDTAVVRLEVPNDLLAADTLFTVANDDDHTATFEVDEVNVATGQYFVQATKGKFSTLTLGADDFALNYGISQIAWRCNKGKQRSAVRSLENEVRRKTKRVRDALARTAASSDQPEGVAATLTVDATLASTFANVDELFTLDFSATERAGTIAANDLPRASVADVAVESSDVSLAVARSSVILSLIDAPANRFTIASANVGGVTTSLRPITNQDTYVITFAKRVSAVYIELVTGNFAVPSQQLVVAVQNGANNAATSVATELVPIGIRSSVLAIVAPQGEQFDRVRFGTTITGFGFASNTVSIVSISTRN